MADKNIKKISDEELEEVAGGGPRPGAGQFKRKPLLKKLKNDLTQTTLCLGSKQ